MKKLFTVLALLAVMGTAKIFAFGIGAQTGYPLGGAVTFKADNLHCIFAVNAYIGNSTSIGVTADWWLGNPTIQGTWGYYYGVGVGGTMNFADKSSYLSVGPRALAGTNVFLLNNFLEFYLQAAYQPTFNIFIGGGDGKAYFKWVDFNAALGFRVWIKK